MADRLPEDIDGLFQQGMEQPQFGYNPVAWSDMELLLDRERRRRHWVWWIFCTLLGMGALGGLYALLRHASPSPAPIVQAPVPPLQTDALNEMASANQKLTHSPTPPDKPLVLQPSGAQVATTRPAPALSAANDLPKQNPAPALLPDWAQPPVGAADQVSHAPRAPQNNVLPRYAPATAPALTDSTAAADLEDSSSHPDVQPLIPLPVLWTDHVASLAPAPVLPAALVPHEPQTTTPGTEKGPDTRGFAVALMGGVEWNAIGLSPFDSMGWRVGAHVEYRFARHWSLGTGLQYSKRNYQAGPDEFQPPYDWIYGIAPTAVKGHCKMLEVPLQISYHPRANNRPGWVFTGGVQAYWVLLETYHYDYDVNYPGQIYAWRGEKTSRSIPGFAHASAGYQWRVHRRLMAELAPYVQAPLQGMGTGKLEVFSFGVNVRVKWMGGPTD